MIRVWRRPIWAATSMRRREHIPYRQGQNTPLSGPCPERPNHRYLVGTAVVNFNSSIEIDEFTVENSTSSIIR